MWEIINSYINLGVQGVVALGNLGLMPLMCVTFLGAVMVRLIIYFTVKSEAGFAMEFEKRVHKHLGDPTYEPNIQSFHELTRKLLTRTHEEHYNLRRKFRRRRFDQITSMRDRIFLIVEGANRLIADTLSQTKYLRKDGQMPRFLDISKFVFESNPVFNRVLGVFPLGMFNDILNILPGLFVVCGIFGTFLGVMGALPELSQIDINDVVKTKTTMDKFLLNMAFSMGSSIVGIVFSVALTILNAMLNPDGIYYSMVNKFTSALEFLWNDTTTNDVVNEESYATDRRSVAFSNLRKQEAAPEEAPAAAKGVLRAAPEAPAPLRAPQPPPVAPLETPAPASEGAVPPSLRAARAPEPEELTAEPDAPYAESLPPPIPVVASDEGLQSDGLTDLPDSNPDPYQSPEPPLEVFSAAAELNPSTPTEEETGETELAQTMEEFTPPELREAPEGDLPTFFPNLGDAAFEERLEEFTATLEGRVPSALDSPQAIEDRISVLKHRLLVLESYLEKADQDKEIGLMSPEMWEDERKAYEEERQRVLAEVAALEAKRSQQAA